MGVGEALVSVLDEKGVPSIVELRANILPPRSSMSIAPDEAVRAAIKSSPLARKYNAVQDRRSAYEELEERIEAEELAAEEARLEEEEKSGNAAKKSGPQDAVRLPAAVPTQAVAAPPPQTPELPGEGREQDHQLHGQHRGPGAGQADRPGHSGQLLPQINRDQKKAPDA